MKRITEDMISPQVFFCSYFVQGMTMPIGSTISKRTVYDYEFEYITESDKGWMWIDDRKVTAQKGDILFRKPGQTTQGVMRYNSIWICFQFQVSKRNKVKGYEQEIDKVISEMVSHPIINKLKEKNNSKNNEKFLSSFQKIFNMHIHPHEGSEIYIKSLMLELIYKLSKENEKISVINHLNSNRMLDIIAYIKSNLDKDLSLKKLSELGSLSPTYFHQQFTEIIGHTPNQYVTEQRMIEAKDLLIHTIKTIDTISSITGFKNNAYFCYVFKKAVGLTPTEFRKKYTQF